MTFFKPTKIKIIIAIVLLLIWYIPIAFNWFFETSLSSICLPILGGDEPTPTVAPLNIQSTVTDLPVVASENFLSNCGPYDPSYHLAYYIYNTGKIVLTALIAYLVSCIIVFFLSKLRKHHLHTEAKK